MKYYINYHTGAGNEWFEGTIEQAMERADDGAGYTQQNITIEDERGREVARRTWWGTEFNPFMAEESELDVIQFGEYGHYGAWHENQRSAPIKQDDGFER